MNFDTTVPYAHLTIGQVPIMFPFQLLISNNFLFAIHPFYLSKQKDILIIKFYFSQSTGLVYLQDLKIKSFLIKIFIFIHYNHRIKYHEKDVHTLHSDCFSFGV
jgi:hypothetical protein